MLFVYSLKKDFYKKQFSLVSHQTRNRNVSSKSEAFASG